MIGLIVGVLAGVLVGTGLACAVGGEDEFCTVTGLALLVGFFGGPILGGYVAYITDGAPISECRWATRLADGQEPELPAA